MQFFPSLEVRLGIKHYEKKGLSKKKLLLNLLVLIYTEKTVFYRV